METDTDKSLTLNRLNGKKILLGVSGGIAAYKAAELLRLLKEQGADVRVVMTQGALAFVTPLTFQALSGAPVHTQLLDEQEPSGMGHIHLARWPDLILIAPASANMLARLAQGFATDLLSTLCLASTAPLWVAPAMNAVMWAHPATQANIATLTQRSVKLLGPTHGSQACGDVGLGRMLEPIEILHSLTQKTAPRRLEGVRILISAGPTREPLDPVRFLSNRSSGKMGYALAEAATKAGACVTLVSGPSPLTPPLVAEVVQVETAAQMAQAVITRAAKAHIYIGTAAVADYAPRALPHKIKKTDETLSLVLERTTDILKTVAALEHAPFTVGFAAETDDLERYALEKLQTKHLDMIAANRVGKGLGFETHDNELHVFWQGGAQFLPKGPKSVLAHQLIHLITDHFHAKHSAEDS